MPGIDIYINAEGAESGARRVTRALESIESSAAKTVGAFDRLKSKLFSLKTAFASLGLGLIARDTLRTANAFDQYRMTLDTLEASHEKAAAKWRELLKFAQDTPFTIREVMDAYKTMKAYGLDPTIEAMRALGDAAAVMGGDTMQRLSLALGQIKATGKVMGQDLIQLASAGINVGEVLKSAFNISRSELDKLNAALAQGVISTQDVYKAFLDYMQTHFGGQMERLNTTLRGQWEVTKSIWQQFADQLMKGGGLSKLLTSALTSLNAQLEKLLQPGRFSRWAEATRSAFSAVTGIASSAVKVIASAAQSLTKHFAAGAFEIIEPYSESFQRIASAVRTFVAQLANLLKNSGLAAFLSEVYEALKSLAITLSEQLGKGVSVVLVALGKTTLFVGKEMTKAFLGVSAILDLVAVGFWKVVDTFKSGLQSMLRATSNTFRKLAEGALNSGYTSLGETLASLAHKASSAAVTIDSSSEHLQEAVDRYDQDVAKIEKVDAAYVKLVNTLNTLGDAVATTSLTISDSAATDFDKITQEEIDALELFKDEFKDTHEKSQDLIKDISQIGEVNKETAKEVSKAWEHAYNRVSDFLTDWIANGKISLGNFFDWIKQSLAQLAAVRIVGAVGGALGLPAASVWAGQHGIGSINAVGGGTGGGGSLLSIGASFGKSLFGSDLESLTFDLATSLYDAGFDSAGSFVAGWHDFIVDNPMLGSGLTAGLADLIFEGLIGGDWGKAAWDASFTAGGAAIGSIVPGIGTAIGATIGNIIGRLTYGFLGDNKPDNSWFHLFTGAGLKETMAQSQSPFGTIQIAPKGNLNDIGFDGREAQQKFAQHVTDLVAELDTQIATMMDDSLEGVFAKGLPQDVRTISWRTDKEDQASKAVVQLLLDRYRPAFEAIDSSLGSLFDTVAQDIDAGEYEQAQADLAAAIQKGTEIANLAGQIPDFFKHLHEQLDKGYNLEQSTEIVKKIDQWIHDLLINPINAALSSPDTSADAFKATFVGQIGNTIAQQLVSTFAESVVDSFESVMWDQLVDLPTIISDFVAGDLTKDELESKLAPIIQMMSGQADQLSGRWKELYDIMKELGLVSEKTAEQIDQVSSALESTVWNLGKSLSDYYGIPSTAWQYFEGTVGKLGLGVEYVSQMGSLVDQYVLQPFEQTLQTGDLNALAEGWAWMADLTDQQLEGVKEVTAARLEELNAVKKQKEAFKDLAETIQEQIDELIRGTSNPQNALERMNAIAEHFRQLAGGSFDAQAIQQHLASLPLDEAKNTVKLLTKDLNDYLQLAQTVYQRPSLEYRNIYNAVLATYNILENIALTLGDVPHYQTGTEYVPTDGLAYLHRGERVVPASENNQSGPNPVVNISITMNVETEDPHNLYHQLEDEIISSLRGGRLRRALIQEL